MKIDTPAPSTPSGSSAQSQGAASDLNPASDLFGPVISTYSRKHALADGVQIDVTETAREAGFRIPVFITAGVFNSCVKVPPAAEGQDEAGRLWDILWMLKCTIARSGTHGDRLRFRLYVRNNRRAARLTELVALCGALDFDDPRPALTITLPNED